VGRRGVGRRAPNSVARRRRCSDVLRHRRGRPRSSPRSVATPAIANSAGAGNLGISRSYFERAAHRPRSGLVTSGQPGTGTTAGGPSSHEVARPAAGPVKQGSGRGPASCSRSAASAAHLADLGRWPHRGSTGSPARRPIRSRPPDRDNRLTPPARRGRSARDGGRPTTTRTATWIASMAKPWPSRSPRAPGRCLAQWAGGGWLTYPRSPAELSMLGRGGLSPAPSGFWKHGPVDGVSAAFR